MTSSNHRFNITDLNVEIDSDNRWIKLEIKRNVYVTVAQEVINQVAKELELDPTLLGRAVMMSTFQGTEDFTFYCDNEKDFRFNVSIKNEENDEYSTPYKYVSLPKGTEDDE